MIRRGVFFLATLCAAPLGGQQRWRLTEDLRIGGTEEGPSSFNEIRDIAVDAKGRVFVLDYQTNEIRLFGADGKFVRLVGRAGSGPGEFRQANGMKLSPDGTLWVNDHRNARYTVFDAEGASAKQVSVSPWGWGYRWDAAFDQQGRLHETISIRTGSSPAASRGVRRYDPARAKFDTLAVPECFAGGNYGDWNVTWKTATMSGVFSVPFAPLNITHLAPNGGWICAAGSEYAVRLNRLEGGAKVSEIRSSSGAVVITKAARDSAIANVYRPESNIPPGSLDVSRIPQHYPRIDEVDVDDEGRVWVRRKTAAGQAIDVWSFNGTRVATIESPVPFEKFRPLVIRNGKLHVVITDADGVPVIVRYAIVRTAG